MNSSIPFGITFLGNVAIINIRLKRISMQDLTDICQVFGLVYRDSNNDCKVIEGAVASGHVHNFCDMLEGAKLAFDVAQAKAKLEAFKQHQEAMHSGLPDDLPF